MAHRKGNKTHAYTAQRSGSKKYAKDERRKRNNWTSAIAYFL